MKKELKIFDKPANVKLLLRIFYISLGILFILDFFIHKHSEFAWEAKSQFFAVYGFVSYVLLMTVAKTLRKFIKRDEDYYGKK